MSEKNARHQHIHKPPSSTMMALYLLLLAAGLQRACVASTTGSGSENDVPLLLTPYLDANQADKARTLSRVQLPASCTECPEPLDVSFLISHAGFLTTNRSLGNHMFFWHFPSSTSKSAPLLLWLNGGPAVSSMLGLFWEHGPIKVDVERFGAGNFGLNPHTWVGPFSVVYVDNPVGTGYSFSDAGEAGYRLTQEEYTDDLYEFVLQFLDLFPEYRSNGLFLGGQSYAGKYVPALGYMIHVEEEKRKERLQNKGAHDEEPTFTTQKSYLAGELTKSVGVDLRGIVLGGPYFDPETESVAFFDYLYSVGVISNFDMLWHKAKVREMYQNFTEGAAANVTFSEMFQGLVLREELPLPSLDNYVTGKEANYDAIGYVMGTPRMRAALRVGDLKYCESNDKLSELYGPDVLVSTKSKMAVLMDNYKVLVYNGDYDIVVSSVMIEAALLTTPWRHQLEYNNTMRKTWNWSKEDLKGFYSQTENFCRVVIHGAGHQTPHDKPHESLMMITAFLNRGCLDHNSSTSNVIVPETNNIVKLTGGGLRCSLSLRSCLLVLVAFVVKEWLFLLF